MASNKNKAIKVVDKLRNEIRTLHEAYQFLSCKYIKHFEELQKAAQEDLIDDNEMDDAMEVYVFGYSRYIRVIYLFS